MNPIRHLRPQGAAMQLLAQRPGAAAASTQHLRLSVAVGTVQVAGPGRMGQGTGPAAWAGAATAPVGEYSSTTYGEP